MSDRAGFSQGDEDAVNHAENLGWVAPTEVAQLKSRLVDLTVLVLDEFPGDDLAEIVDTWGGRGELSRREAENAVRAWLAEPGGGGA